MNKNQISYISDNVYWDVELKKLFAEHQEIKLSISQKKALAYMIKHANKAVQNIDIFYEVYGTLDKEFNEKSVRNIISGLRKLIPDIHITNGYGGYYTLVTLSQEAKEFKKHLFEIIEQSKNAIALTDPNQYDNPIIYVNPAFLELFGYESEELIGNNIRLLNERDRDQEGLAELKEAIQAEKFIEVNIREYTKGGDLIYDDITISPIFDKQREKLIYFLSVHKDTTQTQELLQKLQKIL
jgi:PAS domain S-box-containing protein